MKKSIKFLLICLMAISFTAYGHRNTPVEPPQNSNNGNIIGALIGAILAYELGKDSSNKKAWIGLGLIGGWQFGGHYIKLTQRGQQLHSYTAYSSLEHLPDNSTNTWNNPNSGNSGNFTVRNTNVYNGSPCREFTQTIYVGGRAQQGYGTACRQADGSWKIIQ